MGRPKKEVEKLDWLTEGSMVQRALSIVGYQFIGAIIIYGIAFVIRLVLFLVLGLLGGGF